MKQVFKAITLLMLIAASIAGLYIAKFNKNTVIVPVEDGVVIINSNNDEKYLHVSILDNKSVLPDKTINILAEDATPEKKLQLPVYPSFQESYYTNKSFNSYLNRATVELIAKPLIIEDSIRITEMFTSTNAFPTITGLEIMDDEIKVSKKGSHIELENKTCILTVRSSGDYYEENKRVIWYKTDKDKITFDISISCQK